MLSILILVVSSDSESADVTVSTSPSVDISTILSELISRVDFSGTLDSIRFFTLRWAYWYVALNWDKHGMNNLLPLVIICCILSKNSDESLMTSESLFKFEKLM